MNISSRLRSFYICSSVPDDKRKKKLEKKRKREEDSDDDLGICSHNIYIDETHRSSLLSESHSGKAHKPTPPPAQHHPQPFPKAAKPTASFSNLPQKVRS